LILIPGGFFVGARLPDEAMDRFNADAGRLMSRGLTGLILFLMSVTLNTARLTAALRAPRAVLWAAVVNAVLMPLFAWPLVGLQRIPDFSVGLMIIASVPCTMAAASVWTRAAGGNDAISLLVTMLTNGLCFLTIPFWMGIGSGLAVNLSASSMMIPLVFGAFLPITVGQIARLMRPVAELADRRKLLLSSVAQVCILSQVAWACMTAGPAIRTGVAAGDGWTAAGQVWASCIGLHLAGLTIAWFGSPLWGVTRNDRIAVAFAGSQKTLPIGILIATTPQMLGGRVLPFAILPLLMFHASQLMIDTVVAARLKETAVEANSETIAPEPA
jgi:sodium/bile acid cotransporter 7